MGLYSGGYRKDFASENWGGGGGAIIGRAYFWEGFLSEFYGTTWKYYER